MKKLLLIPIAIMCLNANAQESLKRFKAQSVTLMPFGRIGSQQVTNLSDFQTLSPNSKIIPSNLDGFSDNSNASYPGMGGAMALLGIQFSNKEGDAYKANPVLRIGLSAGGTTQLQKSAYKETRHLHDTLISVKTNERTPVDSVVYENYFMEYRSTEISLDASLIFSTNPAKRWKFYSGFGMHVGSSFTNATRASYSSYYYISPAGDENTIVFNNNREIENQSEAISNKASVSFGAYVPVGVDFTISKNNAFWKKIHLFYEGRGGLSVLNIPELRTYAGLYGQHGFGVKVQWE